MTIGWMVTLYRWQQKWQRQQQAWQWWHQQQSLQSHHTAESIRDGLLQQTFAFRRYLETVDHRDRPTTPEQTAHWLNRFQTFYHTLETLSDELSPPFAADSLPLALQFTLKSWQCEAKVTAPHNWPQSSPDQNQTILSVVTALLTILSHKHIMPTDQSLQRLLVTLSHTDEFNSLTLQISNDSNQSISKILELTEIQHLKEIFHSLIAGQLEIKQEENIIISCLQWPSTT